LLSLGAVFTIFAGYYYWIKIISGKEIEKRNGKILFYSLLIGVNTIFFPQHFLGMAGMPRRIADYPDSYQPWNYVSTIGSMITLMAVFLFIFNIYQQFSNKSIKRDNGQNWYNENSLFPIFDDQDINTTSSLERDLEFILPYPPKYHHFKEVPVV
jgi:heme/copper-type cytochrome/quinol oxidase subunit 1